MLKLSNYLDISNKIIIFLCRRGKKRRICLDLHIRLPRIDVHSSPLLHFIELKLLSVLIYSPYASILGDLHFATFTYPNLRLLKCSALGFSECAFSAYVILLVH